MIKIEHTEVFGWEAAIRGMRNPMNSWDKSDSYFCKRCVNTSVDYSECPVEANDGNLDTHYFNGCHSVGENDLKLMKKLSKAGSDHAKFLRMINVTVDITAPLYWWKEFDTYKVGTVANSCSTMHKIGDKEFELDDFSHEHLVSLFDLLDIVNKLNVYREQYFDCVVSKFATSEQCKAQKKQWWWQMIQLLPSSYNQKRTVQLNYAVLKNMYFARRNHKLDEWVEFCKWIEELPYFKEICIDE